MESDMDRFKEAYLNVTNGTARNITRVIAHHDYFDYYEAYGAHIGVLAIVFLVILILFWIATIVLLLLEREGRRSPVNLLATSIITGHVLAALLLHFGSIRVNLQYSPVARSYCWFWYYGIIFYLFFVIYTLMTYCIERLVYILNPTKHTVRLNKYVIAAMVFLPWIAGVVFSVAVVSGYPNHEVWTVVQGTKAWNLNATQHVCHLENTGPETDRDALVAIVCVMPVVVILILAVTSLIVWCCYKENLTLGTNYMMMGEHVHTTVRDSVIGVALLTFIGVITFIINPFFMRRLPLEGSILALFGFVEGLVFIGTIQSVRSRVVHLCTSWFGLRNRGPDGAVHYDRNTEDAEDVVFQE